MSAFRETPAGEEREFLTGLVLDHAELDLKQTVQTLCWQLTVTDLHEVVEELIGPLETEEDADGD
jgi:hypothetical protein